MPDENWLAELEKHKDLLASPCDLDEYFEKSVICEKKLVRYPLGTVSLPTGSLVACDPLVYMYGSSPIYTKVPAGEFPVELAIIEPSDMDCARNAAMRIVFSDKPAVKFELALTGDEDIEEFRTFTEGDYFGFPVDAGLGCFCDVKAQEAFLRFEDALHKKHGKDFNTYNDYMAAFFAESYKADPRYQRKDGDFINFTVPDTDYHIPICNSGFGDGMYPVYFGYDEDGNICRAVIQFIDIELAYGSKEEE
ncbi:DUF4241 domain-containing protein [Ruminococcus sp.]|uniref:DUF4241 domain-containing protein n=1 Tax=Ruminococcus sp. TaxID=41978 RepID=UPI0025E06CF4|nr:DUF4241 domain-containing protein [Ruminococcus sp.]MBQ8966012.1 DUF4241 domain-containing protein [Ruminococcus sp.]